MKQHLLFNVEESKKKPNTTIEHETPCPFCDELTLKQKNKVLVEEDDKWLIENKFPTFPEAYQTVFIESKDCHGNLANYANETLYDVLLFGLKQWLEMSKNPAFKSVIFFKNHGAEASASLQHPHMHIVGLHEIDYHFSLEEDDFKGEVIYQEANFEWNISTMPKNELYEFNLRIDQKEIEQSLSNKKTKAFKRFCHGIQCTTHFILTSLCANSQSFNVVFYEWNGQIVTKILPRNPMKGARLTPLFLGYRLSMKPSNIQSMKEEIKNTYLPFDV